MAYKEYAVMNLCEYNGMVPNIELLCIETFLISVLQISVTVYQLCGVAWWPACGMSYILFPVLTSLIHLLQNKLLHILMLQGDISKDFFLFC
jgi:hypothetical protein